jgi:hypothetical protein
MEKSKYNVGSKNIPAATPRPHSLMAHIQLHSLVVLSILDHPPRIIESIDLSVHGVQSTEYWDEFFFKTTNMDSSLLSHTGRSVLSFFL